MTDRFRWAIMGTGNVANRFAHALGNLKDEAGLLAVGSRSQSTADAFADAHNIPRRYASYEQLVSDPEVDVVYIATPHAYHHRDITLCLNADKHVLCEKAFVLNRDEAQDVINLARQKNLFLMEALWTRFFPIHVHLRQLLADGTLGEARGLIIHHVYTADADPKKAFDPALGMGALLDQGPYGVGLAISLMGPVEDIVALATTDSKGINTQTNYLLKHPGDRLTTVISSRVAVDVKDTILFATNGKAEIHNPWYKPTRMTVYEWDREPQIIHKPLNGYTGYEFEAQAVMACIRQGAIECSIMPHADTLAILETLDRIRDVWHLHPVE
jgi:predicted dehydrogenase